MPFQFQGLADIDNCSHYRLNKMSTSTQRNFQDKSVCKDIGMITI